MRPDLDRDDTLVGGDAPSGPSSSAGPRIRPSRPTVPEAGRADYATLVEVDPAHYVLEGEIARGGMGRIQRAHDRRLGRTVAVKDVLVSSGALVRRFEREARLTARLQHPSIVAVHEAGKWPSGEPFFAMPMVSGRSLDEVIAEAGTYERRLALLPHVLAIADAMAYAHGQRVIHRDLKPRNVLIGEFGETVVIDWGLAKALGADDSLASVPPRDSRDDPGASSSSSSSGTASPDETTVGDLLGTPSYMPPEQAEGAAVDERADVYAIGSILYHVLAGAAPYVAASSAELLAALHAGPPPALAVRTPAAPRELIAIVERAMARDRADRYPTARELAEDLRRFQTGQLVGAHRYSMRQLVARWARRHRTALIATAAALAVAITVGVFAIVRIVEANHRAEAQRQLAMKNRADAEDLARFMLTDLREKLSYHGRLDLLDAVAQRTSAYYDTHGDGLSDEDAALAASSRNTVARVLESRGNVTGAISEYTKTIAALQPRVDARPGDTKLAQRLAETQLALAGSLSNKGDTAAARAKLQEMLTRTEAALVQRPTDTGLLGLAAKARTESATIHEQQGALSEGLADARLAVDLAVRRQSALNDERANKLLLNAHAKLGWLIYLAKKDTAGALVEYRAALDIAKKAVERDPTNTMFLQDLAISHDEVAEMLVQADDTKAALAERRAGAAIIDKLAERDPDNADFKHTRATLHEKLGILMFGAKDYAAARAEYELCRTLGVELVARDPDNGDAQRGLALALTKLGDVAVATGDAAGALASYQSSIAIREKLVAKDPNNARWRRDLFYGHYKVAKALAAGPGGTAAAVPALKTALDVAIENATKRPDLESAQNDVAQTRVELAGWLEDVHDRDGARAQYTAARELAQAAAAKPSASPKWANFIKACDAALAALEH